VVKTWCAETLSTMQECYMVGSREWWLLVAIRTKPDDPGGQKQ